MRFPAVWLGVLCAISLPAHAQTPRLEGTLTQSGDGVPTKANLWFQPPDSLKIEVLNARGEVAQTVVASENQTLTFDARTKRLGVLKANIAREWFRGAGLLAGGPANFAFSGATGFVAGADQGISRVRDRVLLGNDEKRAFYVASKQRVRAFPVRIEIQNGVRTDFDDLNNILVRAQISFDARHLPLRAVVGTGADAVSFDYALKERATEFPAATFALPDEAKDAIREEDALRAPSAYSDATPDELWNHGLALWRASGDSGGALALWARATLANPRASAPRFSSLEVALATRAPTAASRALEGLKPFLSAADFSFASVPVDELRADRDAGLRDLTAAAASGEPDRKLALSLAQRASGDISGARKTWIELLSPTVPRAIEVKAAENLALSATKTETSALGATLTGDGEGVSLARALLALRGGRTSSATFSNLAFRASFARALERAGQSEAARPLWESLEKSEFPVVQNEARAHLVTILARSGDASSAVAAWNRWNATLLFDTQKASAQNTLFDAFQKAGKTDALRVLLLNRASGTGAKDADLRLNLAFQEGFGTNEGIARASNAGFDRFGSAPFWKGKRAESLVTAAFLLAPIDELGFRKRVALFKQVNELLDQAIKDSPDPTFYSLQKALVQIQRATGIGGLIDANDSLNAVTVAQARLAQLEASADPDFQVVAALGWDSFPTPEDRLKALRAAARALDSAPGDGDRATLVFAARQATARTLEATGNGGDAAKQWAMLLDVSRSADDEAGLVAALLNNMERHKNPAGMAQLLVRVAGERWPLDANAALLGGSSGRVAASPLLPDVVKALDALAEAPGENSASKGALIARAALGVARLKRATAVITIPGAPPEADAELERANRALPPALLALQTIGNGDDAFWATRARLILLEAELLAPDARRALLQQLALAQGGEPSIMLALAKADPDPQAREKIAQSLDFAVDTWRQLALDALQSGDKEGAKFWSREAFEFASSDPDTDANEFQNIGFARARVLWSNGETLAATAIYNSLAGSGWNTIARTTALLGLRKRLKEAGRTDETVAIDARINALGVDKDDVRNALASLEGFDG